MAPEWNILCLFSVIAQKLLQTLAVVTKLGDFQAVS